MLRNIAFGSLHHRKMNKRKRDEKEPPKRTKSPSPARKDGSDDFLLHVLNVSEFVTLKSTPRELQLESLGSLLEVLEEKRAMPGSPISENDVCLLLLPWAVRSILSGTNLTRWTWHSLFVSMNVIVNSNDSYAMYSLSSQVLTQSTLFKLCPKVALFIVSSSEGDASPETKSDNIAMSYATKAYIILTEKLFNPTMDVACKSLLLAILGVETQPSPDYDSVLLATLKLIHRLMIHGKGNPKTIFQLLSSGPILIALSKVVRYFRTRETVDAVVAGQALRLTKKIFSFGLFDSSHHLQGFYSLFHKMKTAPFSSSSIMENQKDNELGSFRCYQEELLATVEQTLSQHEVEKKSCKDILSVIHVISMLFEVFLEQKLEERGDNVSKKKSQAPDPVNMHFQMFAGWMVRLQRIVETGNNSLRSAALQSMLSMLESLLEHNAYSASQHDEGGYFYNFLAAVYNQISASTSTPTGDGESLECSIPILKVLLRLNHRLVHESMEKLIVRSLEVGVMGNEQHAADILVEVFSTYEKLRQQSYAMGAILKALSTLRSDGKNVEADLFLDLLNAERVRLAASQALSSCPILLVKEIFVLLEEWLALVFSEKHNESQNSEPSLCVAVDLLEIVCQSTIVDKSTALHIADLCEHFMENAGSSLACFMAGNKGSFSDTVADLSSSMCAWIIDLHTRCAFWLGRGNPLAIPTSLSEHLSSFMCLKSSNSSNFNGIFNGVALLACNRLTQIDTEIHEEEREAIESQGESKNTDALVLEGKALASSIFNLGSQSNFTDLRPNRHPWFIIAKHYIQWLKFADDDHISLFLRWVCKTTFLPTLNDSQDPVLTTSTCGKVDLFRDSRFMEHDLIYKRLFPEALMASFDLIKLEVSRRGNENDCEVIGLLSVVNHPKSDDSIACSLHYLQQKEVKFMIENPDDRLLHSFRRALYLLRVVAAPSVDARDAFYDKDEALQLLCKLDFAFRALAFPSMTKLPEWKNTHCVLRKIISQQIQPILTESLRKCPKKRQQSLETIERMFESFAMNDQGSLTIDEIAVSSGIEHLVSCIVSALFESGSVSNLIGSLRNIAALATKRKHKSALIAFGRFVSEGVRKYMESDSFSARELTPFLDTLWDVAKLRCETDFLLDDTSGRRLRFEGMLLACDILRLEFNEAQYLLLFDEIADDESIAICKDTTTEEYASQSRVYIIGFLALSCTERARCKRLINAIIGEKEGNLLLDASFINLFTHLTEDDVDELLQKLINLQIQESTLRYLLLSVQCANKEQTTAISKHAQTIFILTTKLLNTCSRNKRKERPTVGLDLALEIVDFLLNHRDVIIFREFDIAVILSHMSAILGDCNQHAVSDVAVSTFSWCATILTSMFQRYSKYLYACVPSVISLYFCLLSYAMFGPDDRKVTQQFAGVCELIVAHKEVYKKHVLGIVLEFVWQVGSLSLENRNRMLPAIYSLLDTMSTYEMQQLNASMGTEHKVLFRTVYQAYQKGHTYKGQ